MTGRRVVCGRCGKRVPRSRIVGDPDGPDEGRWCSTCHAEWVMQTPDPAWAGVREWMPDVLIRGR